MALEKKSRTGGAKTSDRPPASDPNLTTISPSTSVDTGGTATASLLPSLALAIATNRPPPGAPLLSIQEIEEEDISGTSAGTTTIADSAGPSTAPSASAASTSTPPVLRPIIEEFHYRVLPKFISTMATMGDLRKMVPDATGSRPPPADWDLWILLEVAEKGIKETSDFVADMEELKGALEELVTQMEEKMKRDIGSGGSKREGGSPNRRSGGGSGGSEREGGSPNRRSGGGDGQRCGVCVCL